MSLPSFASCCTREHEHAGCRISTNMFLVFFVTSVTTRKLSDPPQPIKPTEWETRVPLFPSVKKPLFFLHSEVDYTPQAGAFEFSLSVLAGEPESCHLNVWERRVGRRRAAEIPVALTRKVKCAVKYLSLLRLLELSQRLYKVHSRLPFEWEQVSEDSG